jgi:hypothetical protein
MGIPRMMKAIDHDIAEAKSAITTNEIIEFI